MCNVGVLYAYQDVNISGMGKGEGEEERVEGRKVGKEVSGG